MSDDAARHETGWRALRGLIAQTLDRYGGGDANARGDYWLAGASSPGWYIQFVTICQWRLLRPDILADLQALLAGYDDWVIEVRIAPPDRRDDWPDMLIEIDRERIVDKLRHDLLPEGLRHQRFGTPIAQLDAETAERVRRLMQDRA